MSQYEPDRRAALTETERKAEDGYECPRCKAKPGARCLKQSATNNYWDRHFCARPHPERTALARADITDQGKPDWP